MTKHRSYQVFIYLKFIQTLLAMALVLSGYIYVINKYDWNATFQQNTLAIDYVFEVCFFLIFAVMLYFIFRPIAEQIRLQVHELKGREKQAKEASRLKSEFVATMSHEIRSPMTGVLGMAELLLKSDLNDDQRNHVKTIYNSGEALLKIIEDVLDFSKIEANRIDLQNESVDLQDLIDDICALYYPRAQEKAVEIIVRYVPGTPKFINADSVRLRQIIGNLINNAIKFTSSGHVLITVKEHFNTQDIQDENLIPFIIKVEDTGIGIPTHMQDKIFDVFVQGDSSLTRRYGGTGLGLSICKRFVEMMNGRITVTSKEGHGSCFEVFLPLEKDIENQENKLTKRPFALQDLKILIVDDLKVIRDVLHEQLSLSGLRVYTSSNGDQAMHLIKEENERNDPFDIVMIDYLMENMNGEKLAENIRKLTLNNLPCLIMLTATGAPIDKNAFVKNGFSSHIAKPFKNEKLIESLEYIWSEFSKGRSNEYIRASGYLKKNSDAIIIKKFSNNPPKVLLVEDSRLNQAFIAEVIKESGAEVLLAMHGREALEIILKEKDNIDIVFMDCQMPVMDGFQAAQEIALLKRRGDIQKDIPIIALTANAMAGDREKCLKAGMCDYLSKPVRSEDLISTLRKWTIEDVVNKPLEEGRGVVDQIGGDRKDDSHFIDFEALDQVKKTFGSKCQSMLNVFIEDCECHLKLVRSAMYHNRMKDAVRPLHTIKSMAARMGASALSVRAENMEQKIIQATAENILDELDIMNLKGELLNLSDDFDMVRRQLLNDAKSMRRRRA